MDRYSKTKKRSCSWAVAVLAAATVWSSSAAALEHGHVRARTRAFVYNHGNEDESAGKAAVVDEQSEAATVEYDDGVVDERPKPRMVPPLVSIGGHVGRGLTAGVRLGVAAFQSRDEREGYLVRAAPSPLRFSDTDVVNRRPPSPALPEFTFASGEYVPYLVEAPLPKDAMSDPSILSELVVELDAHTVTSGKIDTRRVTQEDIVKHFDLEEQRSTVLRPEEVLIFFENNGQIRESGAVIPFSPATPSQETLRSSARLKKE